MTKKGMTRRQFVAGAAVTAAATAAPLAVNVAPAMAAADFALPIAAAQTDPWVPLDPTLAARNAIEIYRGMHLGQGG